jgi:hypothetical protein
LQAIEPVGAVGDGVVDDTSAIEQGIEKALEVSGTLFLESGKTYRLTKPLTFSGGGKSIRITALGAGRAKFLFDVPKGVGLTFTGAKKGRQHFLAERTQANQKFIQLPSAPELNRGDLCEILSTKSWYHDPRPPAGWLTFNYERMREGTRTTLTLAENFSPNPQEVVGRSFTLLSGESAGYARTVTSYQPETKEVEFTPPLPTPPSPGDSYIFNQASKGELNVVERVEDNRIELRNILFDAYEVEYTPTPIEEASVEFIAPITVHLENLELEWTTHPKFNNFEGLRVIYGSDCHFKNVSAINCRRIGFQLERCVNTLFDFCHVRHSNNNFLGYGINVQNSTEITVRNSWFWGCRRGVDFDSVRDWTSAYPSRLGRVESCTNYGGGVRNEGSAKYAAAWFPESGWAETKARNFGFGSHGPAEYITYINNTILNTYRGIFLRGTNERVINNRFVGTMEECIGTWFGGNISIEGNEYLHSAVLGGPQDGETFGELRFGTGENFSDQLPKRFLGIAVLNHSPTHYQRGQIRVKNNNVNAITDEFIYHEWGRAEYIEDLIVQRNEVTFSPRKAGTPVFLLNSNNSADITRYVDEANLVHAPGGMLQSVKPSHRLDDTCIVRPNDVAERIYQDKHTREIRTDSPYSLDTTPARESGIEVAKVAVHPYSKRSKFEVMFNCTITRSADGGNIIVALFRGKRCIATKLIHCPGENVPVEVMLSHSDVGGYHSKAQYTVRIGPTADNRGEVIVNASPHNPFGSNYTNLVVQEISG